MMTYSDVRSALAASVAVCAVAVASPAWAQTRTFDVPAQAAATGIPEFARQADIQILVSESATRGRTTRHVRGRMSVDRALRRLIERTGLRVASGDGRTYTLSAVAVGADSATPGSGETQAAGAAAESESASAEIIVTGSRLPSDGTVSVTTFGEAEIDRLGVNQVADVLRYLPQQSFNNSETTNFGAARTVQLRGLGLGTTLVLINGRRTVTSALQSTFNAFDLNMIPLSAVDRVEVLAESASSVYGADAIGGVVNVILRDRVDRPTADFRFGTADGGAEEYQASLAFSLPIERLRNVFVFDYFERGTLFGRERDRTRNADFTRFGGTDQRVTTANPGNICTVDGANLPGLPTPCAAVPAGSSGVGLTPASFAATAGQTNLYSPFTDLTLIPSGRRYSAVAQLRYDLSASVDAFAEILFVDREDTQFSPPETLFFGFVPDTNPFNPFGVPLFVDYLFDIEAVGPEVSRFRTRSWRLVGGLNGRFDRGEWEASVLYTRDRGFNVTENELDPVAIDAALNETDPARALNIFQDGPGGSAALLASLRETNPQRDRLRSEALQGSAFVRRELFDLPGGPVEAILGAEARRESILVDAASLGIALDADRNTESGFFEVRVPLIGPEQESAFGHRLTITASGRYDHYDDFGGTFNPRLVAAWEPTRSLSFRGSYGTSFRAPALFELYLPATFIPGIPVQDPRRGGQVSFVDITVSGNPDLDPEEARSLSVGVQFAPPRASGLRLGASYWSIEQDQRVVRTNPFLVLANESFFPDLVIRATPTPADAAAGFPGALLAINSPNVNSGEARTSGMDFEATAAIDTGVGRFSPALRVTWVHRYKAADFPFLPITERAGVAQPGGTVPEVSAVGSLAWSRGGFGATVTGRFTSSYEDVDQFGTRNGRDVGSLLLIDLQASLDLGETSRNRFLSGFRISAGALNLFDANPPFTEVSGAYGFDTSQFDIRGRFVYFRLTKAF